MKKKRREKKGESQINCRGCKEQKKKKKKIGSEKSCDSKDSNVQFNSEHTFWLTTQAKLQKVKANR